MKHSNLQKSQIDLTDREKEVLKMIAQGDTSKAIALKLGISYKTVDAHRENIKKKLRIDNIAQLALEAVRRGLVPLNA